MRIKDGWSIKEINEIIVRDNDVVIDRVIFQTGDKTNEISDSLLTQGYADLTEFRRGQVVQIC